jgi:hypothetical protein
MLITADQQCNFYTRSVPHSVLASWSPVTYHEVHRGEENGFWFYVNFTGEWRKVRYWLLQQYFPGVLSTMCKAMRQQGTKRTSDRVSESVWLFVFASSALREQGTMNYGLQFVVSWQNVRLLCDLISDSTSSKERI